MPYVRAVTDDPRKVLHSFRHTFKDALDNAGVEEYLSDRIMG